MNTVKQEFSAGEEKQAAAWAVVGPMFEENREVIAGPGFDVLRWAEMLKKMAALVERQAGGHSNR